MLSDLIYGMDMQEEFRLKTEHLGTLFMMDADKDGRFTLDDIQSFGKLSINQIKQQGFKTHELSQ